MDAWGLSQGTGFGGWGDAIKNFFKWVSGSPIPTDFDETTTQVYEMRSAPGVEKAREAFRQKNIGKSWDKMEPLTRYGVKFGLSGAWRAGSNSTQQFVGSYTVNIFPNSNRTVDIVLTNSTSFFMEKDQVGIVVQVGLKVKFITGGKNGDKFFL